MAYTIYGTGDFERACCNVSASSISGDTITIMPQAYVNSASDMEWFAFVFKLTGADANQPTFKIDWDTNAHRTYAAAQITSTAWRPCYTYTIDDYTSWTFASTVTSASGEVEFQFDEAFTEDTVYISYKPVVRPSYIATWLAGLSGISETTTGSSYGGDDYQINTIASVTDANGRTIPATKQYGFKIGSGSKKIVIVSGVHASEDIADITMIEYVEWLLSDHPMAVQGRDGATFYIYPLINPQGRYGGHFRYTFEDGNADIDPNRDWNDTTGFDLVCNQNIRDAIEDDIGTANVDIFHDIHTKTGVGLIYHRDGGSPISSDIQDWFNEYDLAVNTNENLTRSTTTNNITAYYYSEGITVALVNETADIDHTGTDAVYEAKRYGVSSAVADVLGLYSANTTQTRKILDFGDSNASRYYSVPANSAFNLPEDGWGIAFWIKIDGSLGSLFQQMIGFNSVGVPSSFWFYLDEAAGDFKYRIIDDTGSGPGAVNIGDGYGSDSTVRLWVLRVKDGTFEIWTVTPGNDPNKEYSYPSPWGNITCGSTVCFGSRNGESDKFTKNHLGGVLWKNDGPIEYEDMKALGWGLMNSSDTGFYSSPPNVYFPMNIADTSIRDAISGLTATQHGSSWPTPTVEVSAASTLTQFGFRFYEDDAAPGTPGATVLGDQDANISLEPGSKFRIRMGIVKE